MSREGGGGSGGPGRAWGLGFRAWLGVACGTHLVAGVLLFEPTLFPGGDNAGYMILGDALRSGAGYVDLHLPDAPVHTKYPPLYPAFLAVVGWLDGLQLFKAASLALTTGAVGLTAALGRRWGGVGLGALAGLLMAINPVLLDYSHYVLSEAPFVFLVLAALWAATRSAPRTDVAAETGTEGRGESPAGASPWWALALVSAAAAFLTRTAGLPLLLALVVLPALRRQSRRAVAAAGTAVLVAGGWALVQQLGAPDQAGYLQQLLMVDPYDPSAGTVGVVGLLGRTAENFWRYLVDVLPASLAGAGAGSGAPAAAAGLVVAGLAAAGWMRRCLREVGAGELFVLLYVGTISAWPSVWTDQRFLLPALPLLLVYALLGASGVAGTVVSRGRGGSGPERHGQGPTAAAAALAAAVAAAGVWSAAGKAPDRVRCMARYRAGDPCVSPRQASFYAAARWAREHTPPDAVVVNRKPRIFYWISRRRGTVYPYSSEPDVVLAGIEEAGADYVVVDQISGTTARYLLPAVEAHRNRFEVIYRDGRPPTWILRFTRPPATASLPAARPEGPFVARLAGGGAPGG